MAANNINTWLARADTPTPAISYAVFNKKATAGVMITASHNAPRYNGVKLKASFGGAASPEHHKRVEQLLDRNLEQVHGPNLMDLQEAIRVAAQWPSARLGSIEVRPVEDGLPVDRRYAPAP